MDERTPHVMEVISTQQFDDSGKGRLVFTGLSPGQVQVVEKVFGIFTGIPDYRLEEVIDYVSDEFEKVFFNFETEIETMGWIWVTAKNQCIKLKKEISKEKKIAAESARTQDKSSNPFEQLLEATDEDTQIYRAICEAYSLPQLLSIIKKILGTDLDAYTIICLHCLGRRGSLGTEDEVCPKGMKLNEIADLFGWKESKVKARYYRGKKKILKELRKNK